VLTLYTDPSQLDAVRAELEKKKYPISQAETTLIPKTTVELDDKTSAQAFRLIEKLEDLDDVQNVYTNAEFADSLAEQLEE
jgi:transcriptional/translational regulatory protein YebC/TACO1